MRDLNSMTAVSARERPTRSGDVTNARGRAVGVIACAALALLAGGCSGGGVKLTAIQDASDFDRQVVGARQPVLVDFYKNACPTCVVQEGVLEQLAQEYQGRVTFTKFKIREMTMAGTSPELMDRYKLFWVPTVILFVDGKETRRWVFNHGAEDFRPALNAAAGKAAPQTSADAVSPTPPTAGQPAGAETAQGASDKFERCIEGQGCPIIRTR